MLKTPKLIWVTKKLLRGAAEMGYKINGMYVMFEPILKHAQDWVFAVGVMLTVCKDIIMGACPIHNGAAIANATSSDHLTIYLGE